MPVDGTGSLSNYGAVNSVNESQIREENTSSTKGKILKVAKIVTTLALVILAAGLVGGAMGAVGVPALVGAALGLGSVAAVVLLAKIGAVGGALVGAALATAIFADAMFSPEGEVPRSTNSAQSPGLIRGLISCFLIAGRVGRH